MENERYYHMFANGDDAKDFITSEQEFKSAFNRFAVCSYLTGVTVLSFSLEDSHPHSLLRGTYERCIQFKERYEGMSIKSIARNRGSAQGVKLHCELYEISDESYLLNVGTYTIVQPTKDGKAVMPYDYKYGTGSLYFRDKHSILPWMIDSDGHICEPVKLSSLTLRERRAICVSRLEMPGYWLVCNGFILPTNYVDVKGFESIYITPKRFLAFLSRTKNKDQEILFRMSSVRGTMIEDLEARQICAEMCYDLFKKASTRSLSVPQRLTLARTLRKTYHLAYRQLNMLVHIPESELRKYV